MSLLGNMIHACVSNPSIMFSPNNFYRLIIFLNLHKVHQADKLFNCKLREGKLFPGTPLFLPSQNVFFWVSSFNLNW